MAQKNKAARCSVQYTLYPAGLFSKYNDLCGIDVLQIVAVCCNSRTEHSIALHKEQFRELSVKFRGTCKNHDALNPWADQIEV